MRLVENIPFFSIFIMMAGGIVTPLLGGRNRARFYTWFWWGQWQLCQACFWDIRRTVPVFAS